MFSGIIEALGKVTHLERENTNLHLTVSSPFTSEIKIDQSIAHNGVCLTVVAIDGDKYVVTAIDETLRKTNLGSLSVGDDVNLERCLRMGDRLDGHMVQGHVDQTATCIEVKEENGSWRYAFEYSAQEHFTVSKGSITVNGVSLTVVDSRDNFFSVAIIPYTYEHTTFKHFKVGSVVNIEFDVIGKYVTRYMSAMKG